MLAFARAVALVAVVASVLMVPACRRPDSASGTPPQTKRRIPPRESLYNRVILLVDTTASFKEYRQEALELAQRLVDQLGRQRRRHWETPDSIKVIAIDARPAAVWQGTPKDLRSQLTTTVGSMSLVTLLGQRGYGQWTDLIAALNLAIDELNREPVAAGNWLFVLSDLEHSTLGTGELTTPPVDRIRWDALPKGTVFGAFYVPEGRHIAWENALRPYVQSGVLRSAYAKDPAESRNATLAAIAKPTGY